MDRMDYNSKVLALLSDVRTYKEVPRDPTVSIQNKNNDLVKELYARDIIDLYLAKNFLQFTIRWLLSSTDSLKSINLAYLYDQSLRSSRLQTTMYPSS